MTNILAGVAILIWGTHLCYLGFRKEEAPVLILTEDPKLGKSAHRIYGVGCIVGGLIAIGTEIYIKTA